MSKYVWPASQLTDTDMHSLYLIREYRTGGKVTISRMIALAVREFCATSFDKIGDPNENQFTHAGNEDSVTGLEPHHLEEIHIADPWDAAA